MRDDVLRGDQLDLVLLATEFLGDRIGDLGIGLGERGGKEAGRAVGADGAAAVTDMVAVFLSARRKTPVGRLMQAETRIGLYHS